MPTEQPFRDDRDAALARVDGLERELARARRELEAANQRLLRRRSAHWKRSALGTLMGFSLLFVVLMIFALIFGGCAGCHGLGGFVMG